MNRWKRGYLWAAVYLVQVLALHIHRCDRSRARMGLTMTRRWTNRLLVTDLPVMVWEKSDLPRLTKRSRLTFGLCSKLPSSRAKQPQQANGSRNQSVKLYDSHHRRCS